MKKLFTLIFFFNLLSLILNPVVNADQSVSATIPPRTSDFQFSFASADGQTTITSGTTRSYQITYGAKQSAGLPTSTKIVVDWSSDQAPNNAQLLSYVDGSTSTAYGGAVPVVDLTNHTITWTIPSLPQGTTDQTLTFQFRTAGNYTNSSPVNYTLRASMSNQYFSLPDQTITESYQYVKTVSSPTTTPASKPTTTLTVTPAPTPTPDALSNVSFTDISDSASTVQVDTTEPTKITVFYGSSQKNLNQTVTTTSYQRSNSLSLTGLAPDTTYYLKVLTTNLTGQITTSEIFSFKTAKQSTQPILDNDIIILSSDGSVFLSNTQKQSNTTHPAVILTVNSDYQVTYTLTKPMQLRSIETVMLNKILGANTFAAIQEPSEIVIPMEQRAGTLYTADIPTPQTGSYEVFVRLTDTAGNVIQKKITDLKIMPHLTVYAQDTNLPLADARIFLSYYDTKTHSYQPVTPELFGPIKNPSYTDSLGQSPITLPSGKYRIQESALFYDATTTDFTIGIDSNQNFPILYLKRDPLNFTSFLIFTGNYLNDTWTKIAAILHELSSSIRIFHLISVIVLGSFIGLSFVLFLLRSHIHIKHLPIFVLFHLDFLLNQHKQRYIYGSVTDEIKKPLSKALVEIEDANTKNIIRETRTNKAGKFYSNNFEGAVNLLITKEGFEPTVIALENTKIPDTGLQIVLEKGEIHHSSFLSFLMTGLGDMLGMLFEVSLVLTIILELLFFSIYGFAKTSPYFLLSLINISIWLFYLKARSQKSVI